MIPTLYEQLRHWSEKGSVYILSDLHFDDADGKKPITRILDNEEYLQELDKKLNEEIAEYQADKSIEEMADVLEVLFAICEARGHSVEELMKIRNGKRENRGGFEKKIFWSGNE